MDAVAALMKALADLAWAAIAAYALIAFRKEIASLLTRIRRGKFSKEDGIELELDQLDRSANAAASEIPALPSAETKALPPPSNAEEPALADAAKSPRIGLIVLATEIERELRQLLAATGWHRGGLYTSLPHEINKLKLPSELHSAVRQFWAVRNKLVHGSAANPDDIARAIDSGIMILSTLRAIPRENNVVYHTGVEVYADAAGAKRRVGVKAVILETTGPDGQTKSYRVFPTTRKHFVKGKRVAWEWSNKIIYPESWYYDPDTGEMKYGWTESMEFIGRHLDEI
jgi:hypothetical protein